MIVPDTFVFWENNDDVFEKIFDGQKKFGWQDENVVKKIKMYKIYQLLNLVKDIDGNWSECGVYRGSTAFLLGYYNKKYKILKNNKKIFLFDSFKGLSEPTKYDKGTNLNKGDYVCYEDKVRNNLKKFNTFIFKKGVLPVSFKNLNNYKFSFVHIDLDLYEPTKHALEFFKDKMKKNGIIIVDDYKYHDTPGITIAVNNFEKKNRKSFYFLNLDFGQSILIKKQETF